MHIITVFRVVICFHRGYKGTIEGLGSCVCHSRGREQEQYQHIPDRIRGDYKRPNFDNYNNINNSYNSYNSYNNSNSNNIDK